MEGKDFETAFIEVVSELAKKNGIKHKPLAIKAWPQKKDPGTKWRSIRNGTGGLGVGEAYDLASALGISFLEICGLAQARLLELPEKKLSDASVIPTQDQGTHVHGAADQG